MLRPTKTPSSPIGAITRYLLLGLLLSMLSAWIGLPKAHAQLDRYYYYRTALKYVSRGQFTSAISTINVFLSFLPEDHIALHIRAWAKYSLDDHRGALADLDQALAQKPFMAEALLLRASVLNRLNAPDKAMRDVSLAYELRPNDRAILQLRGITHYLLKEYTLAAKDFEATIRHHPSQLEPRIQLGVTKLLLSDTLAALETFERATVVSPYSPTPYVYMAQIEYSRKRYPQATHSLDEALRIDPTHTSALMVKALILHETERIEEALTLLSKVIALAPRNSLALYNRAIIRAERKQYREALRDYEAATAISPTNVFLRYNMALMQAELNQPKQAIESLSAALRLFPSFARAYATRGHLHLAQGDKISAKADLDSAQHLMLRYQQGKLDRMGDTTALFSRLMAFENDFSSGADMLPANMTRVVELLPISTITLGHVQPHQEWQPVLRADSICGAPFFSLVVPREDSTLRVDVALFPPLRNAYALRVGRAESLYKAHEYDAAIELLREIPSHSLFYPIARYMQAVCLVARTRYASPPSLSIGGDAVVDREPDYSEPLAMIGGIKAVHPSPYLDYSEGVVHFLSKDLHAAERAFSSAILALPTFGEAYYNRALVRLLKGEYESACSDLSQAGEKGIDQAYRVISTHCTR